MGIIDLLVRPAYPSILKRIESDWEKSERLQAEAQKLEASRRMAGSLAEPYDYSQRIPSSRKEGYDFTF